jgi:hypothetical protein
MYWEIISILSLFIVLYLGKKRKTSYIGEFFIGVIYGLYWELSAHRLFEYSGFSVYIYQDVPLAIIILWGVVIAGFTLISDYLQQKYPIKHKKLPNTLVWDILVAGLIGTAMEILGSQILNMWTYPPDPTYILLYGIPFRWIRGWFFIGLFVMGFNRYYQNMFEINRWRKKLEKK